MTFNDDEFREWHEHLWKQRNLYKNILEDIVCGVPTIAGMASEYRKLKMEEIVQMCREVLER